MKLFLMPTPKSEEPQFELTEHEPMPNAPWIEVSENEYNEYLWAHLYLARWQQRIIHYCEIPEGFDDEPAQKAPKRRKGSFLRRQVSPQ